MYWLSPFLLDSPGNKFAKLIVVPNSLVQTKTYPFLYPHSPSSSLLRFFPLIFECMMLNTTFFFSIASIPSHFAFQGDRRGRQEGHPCHSSRWGDECARLERSP